MAIVVDSYSEENSEEEQPIYDASHPAVSQSFTPNSNGILNSSKFYCLKYNSPTGSAYSKIYAHSGTYGISSVPTGGALATSDAVDVSGIDTSLELVTFTFSTGIQLDYGTHYVATVEYDDDSLPDAIGVSFDFPSATHSGNAAIYQGGDWQPVQGYAFCFYIYINDDPCPHIAGICTGSV